MNEVEKSISFFAVVRFECVSHCLLPSIVSESIVSFRSRLAFQLSDRVCMRSSSLVKVTHQFQGKFISFTEQYHP